LPLSAERKYENINIKIEIKRNKSAVAGSTGEPMQLIKY
jgi:hypothetical protein